MTGDTEQQTTAAAKADPVRVRVQEALKNVPNREGLWFSEAFCHGSLSVEIYTPKDTDPQTPHSRDEVYLVLAGHGTFYNGHDRHPFGPGDLLFVPAGVEHRFEGFSDDLTTWVIFFGPEGGEQGMSHKVS